MPDADVLIVGASTAGSGCAEVLRSEGFEGSIVLVGRESDPPYHRPPASKGFLSGKAAREDVLIRPVGFWEEAGIDLRLRTSVTRIDADARTAKLATGDVLSFGSCVLATGSNVRRLRAEGSDLDGIHYLRTLGNAESIRAEIEGASKAVLIGGSFIACEVAATLASQGLECTLVMLEDAPLSLPFGDQVGDWFASQFRERGIELVTGDALGRFEGAEGGRVERVITESGRELDADVVVVGAGVVPDVMLARAAGLKLTEKGAVECDWALRTSADGIWACGDIADFPSEIHGRRLRVEHWETARAQGKHVGHCIAHGTAEPFQVVPYFWSDLADWGGLEYVGPASDWDREIVRGSMDDGEFSVFYVKDGRVAGCLGVGRSEDVEAAKRLIAEKVDVSAREDALADPGSDLDAL